MKILLLGKDGQVGWELQRSLAPLGELLALGRDQADFTRPGALAAAVRALAPDVIVNAAAYTAVDQAELEPAHAFAVNADAVAVLAREAAAAGCWLVHYSSDYVLDGSGQAPWTEDAPTGPLNTYGRSKLAGEEAIRASGCKHLILRSSWVYARHGSNFASSMLDLAVFRERIEVVGDQIGAPTEADLLADISAHAIRCALATPALGGTYHVAAAGETSWHGYARHVIEFARAARQAVRVPADSIIAVPSSAMPRPAHRPLNSRLDCSKPQRQFGLQLPHWCAGLDRMLCEVLGR